MVRVLVRPWFTINARLRAAASDISELDVPTIIPEALLVDDVGSFCSNLAPRPSLSPAPLHVTFNAMASMAAAVRAAEEAAALADVR